LFQLAMGTIWAPVAVFAPEWNSITTGCAHLSDQLRQHLGGIAAQNHDIERANGLG
jgi:hypothetical protein